MKQYVEYQVAGGGSVIVEAEEIRSGMVPAATTGEVIAKAEQKFDDLLDGVKPIAGKLVAKLRDFADPPDEVAVEFALKLGFKAGIVLASGDTEANIKVNLKWTRPRESA